MRRTVKIFSLLFGLTLMLFAYNNCGAGFESYQQVSQFKNFNSETSLECDGFPNGFEQIDPVNYFTNLQGVSCDPLSKRRTCVEGKWSDWTSANLTYTQCRVVVETCDGFANNFVQIDPLNYYIAATGMDCTPFKKKRTCIEGNWSEWTNKNLTITTCTVDMIANNKPPVAKISFDNINLKVGQNILFDSVGSSDPEGSALTYMWSLEGKPATSNSNLGSLDKDKSSLTIDYPGDYVVALIVSDGKAQSSKIEVKFNVTQSVAKKVQLIGSSFVDGDDSEVVRDVAIDSLGNVYVTGGTTSKRMFATQGSYDTTFNGGGNQLGSFGAMDAFVSKYSPQGKLLWSTYLGGPNYDRAYAIEVDGQGNVYIGGRAGAGFPTTPGVVQTNFAGDNHVNSGYGPQDGFVTKLSADGKRVLWSTYIGGSGRGFIRDIDIDSNGQVYAGLSSVSQLNNNFITGSAVQKNIQSGTIGAAIVRLSNDARSVIYGSYLGGATGPFKYYQNPSVRVSSSGDYYIMYVDDGNNSPATSGSYKTRSQGGSDIVAARFRSNNNLVFCSYLGGSKDEGLETHNLALSKNGDVIISGGTTSANFPTTNTAHQRNKGTSLWGSFITKLSADGKSLIASTFFSGNNTVGLEGIDIDDQGQVYFSGPTRASNLKTTTDAISRNLKGIRDGYVAKMSSDLKDIIYLSYFGSTGDDQIRSAILSKDKKFVVVGHNQSANGFPLLNNSHDKTVNGNINDAFKTNSGFYGLFQF